MIRMLPFPYGDEPAFCLYDDAKLLSECVYSPESGEIKCLRHFDPQGEALQVALLKAVLSSMEYAGCVTAWSANPDLFQVLKVMRFREDGDKVTVSLKGYFDNGCN